MRVLVLKLASCQTSAMASYSFWYHACLWIPLPFSSSGPYFPDASSHVLQLLLFLLFFFLFFVFFIRAHTSDGPFVKLFFLNESLVFQSCVYMQLQCENACVYAYFHVYGCMCVPKVNVWYLSQSLSTHVLRQGLQLNAELFQSGRSG